MTETEQLAAQLAATEVRPRPADLWLAKLSPENFRAMWRWAFDGGPEPECYAEFRRMLEQEHP